MESAEFRSDKNKKAGEKDMTLGEKALTLIAAQTDEEKYAAVAKLTDRQKDIMIVSLMKVIQEQGFHLDGVGLD